MQGANLKPQRQGHASLVAVYSLTHFLVDFACAFFMFRNILGTPNAQLGFLLYNFCAFALQMPLGLIADKCNRNYLFAIIGCALVAGAFALPTVPLLAVLVLGCGNALFHLGGGIDVLNISTRKADALGVFVSPGAMGVFLGALLGKGLVALAIPLVLILGCAIALIIIMRVSLGRAYPQNAIFSLPGDLSPRMLLAVIFLFLVVCLRSFAGLSLSFSWKGTALLGFLLVCAVVLGKTFGGFAADKWGAARVAIISLGAAAVLFLVSFLPVAGIAAIFLFNMTMPITLWAMARIFPGAKGFSFGLLTFGLFLGYLPSYLGIAVFTDVFWLYTLVSLISLVLIWLGIKKAGQYWSGHVQHLE